jgi:urease accessory protein
VRLWQLIDSAFPSGGFAHSWGLEASYQAGEVRSDAALKRYLRDTLWQTGRGVLPLLGAAHREPSRFDELDALCDTFLTNAVANRASRQQGRAWLASCARIWPGPELARLDACARRGLGHYAPAAGAAMRALQVPLESAQQLALYGAARGVLAAAIRLGIAGPFRAQQLQHECDADLHAVMESCGNLDLDALAQTAPIADLLQSTHDRLYSRLFQS